MPRELEDMAHRGGRGGKKWNPYARNNGGCGGPLVNTAKTNPQILIVMKIVFAMISCRQRRVDLLRVRFVFVLYHPSSPSSPHQ